MKKMLQIGVLCAILFAFVGVTLANAQTGATERANPEQVRENLKGILDSKEFQTAKPAEPGQLEKTVKWVTEQWDKFVEWFRKLFRFSGGGIGKSPGVQWVFIFFFLLLGAWLAYRLVRNAITNRPPKKAEQRTAFDLDEDEAEIVREPDAWLAESEKWVGEGDYRRAYRALFLAILLQFDKAGIVPFERSRTNGEYLRVLRRSQQAALADVLRPLVLEFDLRWYGEKTTTSDDVAAIREAYVTMKTRLEDPANATGETPNFALEKA